MPLRLNYSKWPPQEIDTAVVKVCVCGDEFAQERSNMNMTNKELLICSEEWSYSKVATREKTQS